MVEGILFEQVEDSRQDWKVKHSISEILMVVMCGVSAGERTFSFLRHSGKQRQNDMPAYFCRKPFANKIKSV